MSCSSIRPGCDVNLAEQPPLPANITTINDQSSSILHHSTSSALPSAASSSTIDILNPHHQPLEISPEIHAIDPQLSDPEQVRTESLLQNVDLSVLSGKKSKKKKKKIIHVSVIPIGSQFLSPWLSYLGMTEYESKHQRSALSYLLHIPPSLTPLRLHDEIVAYTNFVSPTPTEVQARRLIVSAVQAAVDKILTRATVSVFGSVASDLCLPNE
jgi:hypothetical protein